MITIYLPRFNVTVSSMLINDIMSDSFYINGAVPPSGNVTLSRAIERTVKGKKFVFSVADAVYPSPEDKENAAHLFVELIKDSQEDILSASEENYSKTVDEFVTQANGKMRSVSFDSEDYGTSFALLTINNGTATMVNAGDVRGYVFSGGKLTSMTESNICDKLFAGVDTIPDGKPVKYVGCAFGGDSIEPHFSDAVSFDVDDVFLMCSNGLTDMISEERIEYILSLDIPDEKIVHRLISEAVAGGAEDNITVMLIRNGGKPIKQKKSGGGFFKLVIPVILLAVLTAFITSSLRSCSGKPEIEEEPSSSEVLTTPPEENEFMTPESSSGSGTEGDDFILRSTSPAE